MKTIYLVRHGQSEGNVGLVFQGMETPLTERGFVQAGKIAERCANLEIQTIISSPMKRAFQTAEAISKRIQVPIEVSEYFSERRRPSMLVTASTADPEASRINEEWFASTLSENKRVLDGEDFFDVRARAQVALKHLAEHPSEKILVASHGYFLNMLLASIALGETMTAAQFKRIFDVFHTSNTGLSIIRHGGEYAEWEVLVWNDHAHLG